MPTTLPERRQPPPGFFVVLGVALVILIGLLVSRGPVLTWVREGRPMFVSSDASVVQNR